MTITNRNSAGEDTHSIHIKVDQPNREHRTQKFSEESEQNLFNFIIIIVNAIHFVGYHSIPCGTTFLCLPSPDVQCILGFLASAF